VLPTASPSTKPLPSAFGDDELRTLDHQLFDALQEIVADPVRLIGSSGWTFAAFWPLV
jgi:hypothetical protein